MKENFKKIIASVLTFTLVLTMLSAFALPTKAEAPADETPAHMTKVVITKWDISGDAKASFTNPLSHDGKEITAENNHGITGTLPKGLSGVKFGWYKANNAEDLGALKDLGEDVAKLDKLVADNSAKYKKGATEFTDVSGKVEVDLEDGYYWIVELKKPAAYESSLAVPFELQLPAYVDGKRVGDTDAADKLYVYPKNEITKPFDPTHTEVDGKKGLTKEVASEGATQTSRNESFDKGNVNKWEVTAYIPKAVGDYTRLEINDKLSSKLQYTDGTLKVYKNDQTELTNVTDYTLTTTGNKLSVKFTETGISKLVPGERMKITFDTSMVEDVVMGDNIYNGVQVIYAVQPNNDGTSIIPANPNETPTSTVPDGNNGATTPKYPEGTSPDPDTIPEGTVPGGDGGTDNGVTPYISTGGKKFVKVDSDQSSTKLAGAKFAVVKENENGLEVLLDKSGVYSWVTITGIDTTNRNNADLVRAKLNDLADKASVKYLLSDATEATKGSFEIKGLKYGSYKLLEVVAPESYALRTELPSFTIDATSYYSNVKDKTVNLPTASNAGEVQNKKYTIPQTGGIGTIVFIVAGVVMMGAALLLYKKGRAE